MYMFCVPQVCAPRAGVECKNPRYDVAAMSIRRSQDAVNHHRSSKQMQSPVYERITLPRRELYGLSHRDEEEDDRRQH